MTQPGTKRDPAFQIKIVGGRHMGKHLTGGQQRDSLLVTYHGSKRKKVNSPSRVVMLCIDHGEGFVLGVYSPYLGKSEIMKVGVMLIAFRTVRVFFFRFHSWGRKERKRSRIN